MGCRPFPHTPFSASIRPSLHFGHLLLKPNTSCTIETPRSYAPIVFGIIPDCYWIHPGSAFGFATIPTPRLIGRSRQADTSACATGLRT